MMFEELYQEIIFDHYKQPRNRGEIAHPSCQAEGNNPLCGDNFTVYILLKENVINEITFKGMGCAISTASASMMTELLKNQPITRAKEIAKNFHEVFKKNKPMNKALFQDLLALENVKKFPMRVKCATLPWHSLLKAIEGCEKNNGK